MSLTQCLRPLNAPLQMPTCQISGQVETETSARHQRQRGDRGILQRQQRQLSRLHPHAVIPSKWRAEPPALTQSPLFLNAGRVSKLVIVPFAERTKPWYSDETEVHIVLVGII